MESGEPGVAVYRRAKSEIKSSLFKLQDHIFSLFLPGTRLEDLQDSETLGVGTRATEHRAGHSLGHLVSHIQILAYISYHNSLSSEPLCLDFLLGIKFLLIVLNSHIIQPAAHRPQVSHESYEQPRLFVDDNVKGLDNPA